MLIPLKLTPAFKDYLWGGTRLREEFNKKCEFDKVAESWELACHKDGNSVIQNGPDAGMTLADYIAKYGKSILGTNSSRFDSFPVLIKLIDAKDNLSVQVHPENEYALRTEGEYGKTEMWYIIDCEQNSSLLYGFKHNISKEEFRQRIENNTLLDVTRSVPVKKGDTFFIKAGTLHAIGKGILIAEIQQNSNTTYRIYDYDRKDKNGKGRELHIDKACEVTDLSPADNYPDTQPVSHVGFSQKLLSSCDYFNVNLLNITDSAQLCADAGSFEHLLVIDGTAVLNGQDKSQMQISKGDSIFIPAGAGQFSISGKCQIIKTNIQK